MRRRLLLSLALGLGLVTLLLSAEPVRAQAERAGVVESTYTSPQFGFRVRWQAPWALAADPRSKPGRYDVLSLVAGEMGIEYGGISTRLDPATFFQGAIEVRRRQFPDLIVAQPYQGGSGRIPAILSYSADGVQMTDVVDLQPLPPGQSLLMITKSFPAGTSETTRRKADEAVHLELLGLTDAVGGTPTASNAKAEELVTRLLTTPIAAGALPAGYAVQQVTRVPPDKIDTRAVGGVEFDLKHAAGLRRLRYVVYASETDAQRALTTWLRDQRSNDGVEVSLLPDLADQAAIAIHPGSEAAGKTVATGVSVAARHGNVLILIYASDRNVVDPGPPRAAAYSLALAGIAHLEQVLASGSAGGGAKRIAHMKGRHGGLSLPDVAIS